MTLRYMVKVMTHPLTIHMTFLGIFSILKIWPWHFDLEGHMVIYQRSTPVKQHWPLIYAYTHLKGLFMTFLGLTLRCMVKVTTQNANFDLRSLQMTFQGILNIFKIWPWSWPFDLERSRLRSYTKGLNKLRKCSAYLPSYIHEMSP